jgi:hypothetical protein
VVSNVDVAVAAVLVSVILGALGARRAAYERVIRALDLLSEGDVAKARHRLGSLVFAFDAELGEGRLLLLPKDENDGRIEDLFTILSAATRLDAIRLSLGPRWPRREAKSPVQRPIPGARGPHRLLVESASNWVHFWVRPAVVDGRPMVQLEAIAHGLAASLDSDDMSALTRLKEAWPAKLKEDSQPS